MRSSFAGLQIALRGLQVAQIGQETTGHNISNADTAGYSRQEIQTAATKPYSTPTMNFTGTVGQLGTGVELTEITRYHDAFLDLQYRSENQELGKWTVVKDTLDQIELIMPEPSNSGLNTQMSKFWSAWEDLSNAPNDEATRSAVRQQASNLCSTINSVYDQLTTLKTQLNSTIPANVTQVNSFSKQIADLNLQIKKIEMTGQNANDLRDQRDLFLDKLSNMVGITTHEEDDGQISVYVGGSSLVYGQDYNEMSVIDSNADGQWDIQWTETELPVKIASGELAGTLTSRDEIVADQVSNLNKLAVALRDVVNTVHRTGYGTNNSHNIDFFSGTGADDLALSASILADTNNIAAASATDSAGDGTIASKIAALKTDSTAAIDTGVPPTEVGSILGGKSITDFYQATMIEQLAIDAASAEDNVTNTQSMVDNVEDQRDSLSGVSIDDETANLIRYQRAYQAAARVMTVVDEMLDRLINGTGTTGR